MPYYNPPGYTQGCRVYNNGNITINNTNETTLTFNTERYDTDSMHDTGSNTSRITFTTAGKYEVGFCLSWSFHAIGFRQVKILLNGTTIIGLFVVPAVTTGTQITVQMANTIYNFSASDYVELLVYQDSSATLNINAAGNYSPEFWAQRVG